MSLMPYFTTATELQRNYKKVVRKAKKVRDGAVVLSKSRPDMVFVDYDRYSSLKEAVLRRVKSSGIEAAFGVWTKHEAEEFNAYIDETFEKIDEEMWK